VAGRVCGRGGAGVWPWRGGCVAVAGALGAMQRRELFALGERHKWREFKENKNSFPMMVVLASTRKESLMSGSRTDGGAAAPSYRQELLQAMRIFLVAPLFAAKACVDGRWGR
jgi:hypothetical protein